jgi:cytochrome c-type biogenesis protein CcmH
MMIFWVVAAVLILGALLFIVPPLMGRGRNQASASAARDANLAIYRDQLRELDADLAVGALSDAQYKEARDELEKRALEDSANAEQVSPPSSGARWWAIAVVIAVPLLTISLYLLLGKPGTMDAQRNKPEGAQPQVTQEQIESMVASLAKKLEANPNDAQGWAMLGRSYGTLRRFDDARNAYAKAVQLAPDNSELLTDYADVLAMTNGRNVVGEPEKIILHALEIDPRNIKALALAGTAAFQRKDYPAAISWWQKIVPLVPADSPMARSIKANISQAEGLSGQPLSGGAQKK